MANETIKNETFLGDTREFCERQKLEEIKKQKYLDPLYDAAFKAFLSDEQALVSFLNGVFHLGGDNKIKSVTVKNTEINIIFSAGQNVQTGYSCENRERVLHQCGDAKG